MELKRSISRYGIMLDLAGLAFNANGEPCAHYHGLAYSGGSTRSEHVYLNLATGKEGTCKPSLHPGSGDDRLVRFTACPCECGSGKPVATCRVCA